MAGDRGPLPVRPLDKAPAAQTGVETREWKKMSEDTCKDTWCWGKGFKADTGAGEGRRVRLQVRWSSAG